MNNRESLVNFILSIVEISKDDADQIANTFHPIEIEVKDYLLRENEVSDDYFYLESGLMRTFLFNLKGEEITIDFFTENNIVFEITSFFNRVRSEAYIQAITNCKGFRI